jgi:hypothetical protein
MTVYSSPEVARHCQQARQLAEAYKIDAVPAMGVQAASIPTATSPTPASREGPGGRNERCSRWWTRFWAGAQGRLSRMNRASAARSM